MATQTPDNRGNQPTPSPTAIQNQQAAQTQLKSLQGAFTKANQQLDASKAKLAQDPTNKGIQAQFAENKKDMLGVKQDVHKAQANVQATKPAPNQGPRR